MIRAFEPPCLPSNTSSRMEPKSSFPTI
jgi:hypothetical protein